MKKRLLIAGCSHCLREYLFNGLYYLPKAYELTKLYKKYEVYNLSKKNLTSKEALKLVSAYLNTLEFSGVFLSLGEADITLGVSPLEFKSNLDELISLCKQKNISIVLNNEINKKEYNQYYMIVEELRIKNQPEYKYVSKRLVKA